MNRVQMETKLKVEKMVHGGFGLCRTDNGVVFVSDGLPGETVRAVVERPVGGQAHASALEILEPSPFRRKPACPLAGICGGCDWLHIEYKAQMTMKLEIFRECLKRIGKIDDAPEITVCESPEFEYRRRVQFKVDQARNAAGFFRRKSSEVVAIAQCPILCGELNNLLAQLPSCMAALPKGVAQLKAICGTGAQNAANGSVLSAVASSPVLPGCTVPTTEIEAEGRRFVVDGESFFQSNRFLCGTMGQWAADLLEGETLWDLFGGAGFFSVFLGKRFTKGVLVDNEQCHIAAARKNLRANGIPGITAEAATAAQFLCASEKAKDRPDCIVVDPPREGLQKNVRELLAAVAPSTLLYVSCDPATQARDAGFLIKKCGYRIDKAALFDCYPQTHHLETMLLLRR
jgi:23S rRNA (uracil1939-C5)-methyltransferase